MNGQSKTQEALIHFIDNWTCDEFVGFVDDCEALVNGLVRQDDTIAEKCEQVSSDLDLLGSKCQILEILFTLRTIWMSLIYRHSSGSCGSNNVSGRTCDGKYLRYRRKEIVF